MKKYFIFIAILGLILLFFINQNNKTLKQSIDPLEYEQKRRKEYADIADKKIQIFGKVIDGESNNPLPNVYLELIYNHYSPMPPYFFGASMVKATSDENGLFLIDNIYGRFISLRKITKENYWEREQKNNFPNPNLINYIPDKTNPVIFKLYKEVKDNYLLRWNGNSSPHVKDGTTKVYNYGILDRFVTEREKEKYDFQCKFERIGNKTIINLKGFDESCNFYLNDKEFLSEAELLNFKNTIEIEVFKDLSIVKDEEIFHYLYIRFNKLQLYAKTKCRINMSDNSSHLDLDFIINPFGEYNFETFDESKIDSSLLVKIDRDFEKLLKEGVLPKRIDLKKYLNITISENKPKQSKEKKKLDFRSNTKNSKMNFYGKISDDKGKAIPEAIVAYSIFHYNDKDEIQPAFRKVKADKNGLFAIEDVWGFRLRVVDIFKFEYFRNRVIRGNFEDRFFIKNFSDSYLPNKDKPEEFQLVNELSGNFNDINQYFAPRIIKISEEKDFYHKFLNEFESSDSENYDLKVNIKLLKEKCIVNISSREENSGIFISDDENISSSDQQNTRKVSFEFSISEEGKNYKRYEKYLLVKFLNGRNYSKLHLDFLIGNSECQFYAENKINLFGTKEFDDFKKTKYTGRIYKHLRERNELTASNGEMEGVLDKNDFIKEYNNPFLKAQFKVPPETDPRLEFHIDEMKEFLQYRIFEEDEIK